MSKILIVEDEKNISKLIQDTVSLANYEFDCSFDGEDALKKINENTYDLILLDIMLPKLDGFQIVEQMENKDIPIIFLSAKNDVSTIVKGLKSGGKDYITKPFEPLELLARIELRMESKREKEYNFKNIKINENTRTVYKNEQIIYLAPKEYELFILLIKNQNRVLTRDEILNKVWDINAQIETRTVDYHIQQLRKKLDLKENIVTVNKIGYILK
ncbi:MAG: response regulator transcription factor [Clostridia bacterium]|nr:response regulator transcription factor [Clostridia bacterium]